MHFTAETANDGVTERLFELEVSGERVPGVIWSPTNASGSRPLVLMGHGGSQHKKVPRLVAHAHRYVTEFGYAVAALDAPNHGDRPVSERFARFGAELRASMAAGKSVLPEVNSEMAEQAALAVPEWRAALDALATLDFIGADRPVGYWGLSMGTAIGVPLVAAEPRITAAVFGLAGIASASDTLIGAAAKVTIPVEFVLQWDDELVRREWGGALFELLGSKAKTLHTNPGGHMGIPAFEADSWARFFARHLTPTSAPAAR